MPNNKPAKILIIRFSAIGDIILTSPLVRQLRQRYPDAQIDFLIRKEYAEVMRHNPHLSRLIWLDTTEKGALKTEKKRIRSEKYDVVLDLQGNLRSFWLRKFCGAESVLRVRKNKFLRHLLVNYKINLYHKFYPHPLSVTEKYLQAALPLGVVAADIRLELFLPPHVAESMRMRWQQWHLQNFHVVMAPGARHYTKRWPAENYRSLIGALYQQFGWKTLLVGGPEEQPLTREITAGMDSGAVEDLTGQLTLLETFALIAGAPLFVSNDSGLMHAAAAFGVPQVAIFGSTVREFGFYPLNQRAVILENNRLNCRPCSHIGKAQCPKRHFRCMREITVNDVKNALAKLDGLVLNRQ
jgi:heptosyltransferase-2